ncbi:phage minor tail protein L [Pseudaestuariivita rosea]|uniref:phage minor tail protein L n=1 Tax=Pseudaestuariivita rosea TaxID=2763263 RepID=UPI001ABA8804|nr:phage minor tail protein L [Pseudaestuariivita rosea]
MDEFVDSVRAELETFEVGEVIDLFTVDARKIGGDVYHFAPTPVVNAAGQQQVPVFAGQSYTVIPFESEGWDWVAGGPLPRPTVRFLMAREDGDQASAAAFLLSLVEVYNDFLGATLTRMQTLRKHLDDGDDPNPQAHLGVQIYIVAQKTNQTPVMVEFQLQAALDLEDVILPRRQVLNYCQWTYRRANPDGTFDYTNATCPYVGPMYFDANGNRVESVTQDRCGKSLTDCKLRFGENARLPFGGFPGAGKFRA